MGLSGAADACQRWLDGGLAGGGVGEGCSRMRAADSVGRLGLVSCAKPSDYVHVYTGSGLACEMAYTTLDAEAPEKSCIQR